MEKLYFKLKETTAELEKTMQCNCDLDNWQPVYGTGHSQVCRIFKEAWKQINYGPI